MAAETDLSGILAQLVVQPASGSPHYDSNGGHYTEIWKGPYNILRQLPSLTTGTVSGYPKVVVGYDIPIIPLKSFKIDRPPVPDGMSWVVTDVNVEEIEAGDHGKLTINCYLSNPYDWSSSSSAKQISETTWEVGTNNFTRDIFSYCGPSEGANPNVYRLKKWMAEPDTYLQVHYEFKSPGGEVLDLLAADKALAGKIQKGERKIYDWNPVIKKNTKWSGFKIPNFGKDINTISKVTDLSCPFANDLTSYEFLKTNDNITYDVKTHVISRSEIWNGAYYNPGLEDSHGWDPDFYGKDRWPVPYTKV